MAFAEENRKKRKQKLKADIKHQAGKSNTILRLHPTNG